MSSLMETPKIIHIVAEVILLGAVSYYLNSQIKSVRHEVKDLKAKLVVQEESFNKHINTLYGIIDKMNNERKQMAQDLMSLRNFLVPRMNISNNQNQQQVPADDDEDDDHHEINLQQTLRQRRPQNSASQVSQLSTSRQSSKPQTQVPISRQSSRPQTRVVNVPQVSTSTIIENDEEENEHQNKNSSEANLDDELGDELKDLEQEEELELKDNENISNKQSLKKN
jgi:hypothetical protein